MRGKHYFEGARSSRQRARGQGNKLPAIPQVLLWIGLAPDSTPRQVPVAYHRLGGLGLATLPGEFTTVMGGRVRASIRSADPSLKLAPLTIGLAEAYSSYFTSPEEYAMQHYEGGSTLFGPWAATFVLRQLSALATPAAEPVPDAPRLALRHGPVKRFALQPGRRGRRLASLARSLVPTQLALNEAPVFEFSQSQATLDRGTLSARPRVFLEALNADGAWSALTRRTHPLTDHGFEFATYVVEENRTARRWRAHWIGDVNDADLGPLDLSLSLGDERSPKARSLRFVATLDDGTRVCSESFPMGDLGSVVPGSGPSASRHGWTPSDPLTPHDCVENVVAPRSVEDQLG